MDFDFRNPDYAAVFRARGERLARIRAASPADLIALKAFYRQNITKFISDWGCTFDPRNIKRGLPSIVPFILFDKQIEFANWVVEHWRGGSPGLCEKSRDMGVSWLAIAIACALCNLFDGMVVGFGSRKTIYVDQLGDMKSLFEKGRFFMRHLPQEFRGGWDVRRDAPQMRIFFPGTGSLITGEGGNNVGRGDRTGIYFVDEAQPLSAKIMTPQGWRFMSEVEPGCAVTGRSGHPTQVTQVKDCGVHDVFRLTFSDGTTADASPNHLWTVDKVWGKRERLTLRTHEIADRFAYESPGGQTQYLYRIPVCDPVHFEPQGEFPLDPYVVGALLGDGSVKAGPIRVTSADVEVLMEIEAVLPLGVKIGAFDGRYTHNIVDIRRGRLPGGSYGKSRAVAAVIAAGIVGLGSATKFVPDRYKFASPADRLSLLQGLLDTDGSATGGTPSFYTTSPRLAEDVRFLVQSLGGSAWHNVKPDARGYRDLHDIHLMLPPDMPPFQLPRKLQKLRPRVHPPGRTIIAVQRIDRQPVRCITVAADDGLYLTDSFIVTHNSAFFERPQMIEASLSQTTDCRIDMSSANGMANPFAEKRHSGDFDVFTFHWRDDPRKDEAWYALQAERLDPVILASEVDIDYHASLEGKLIPHPWIIAAVDAHLTLQFKPSGERRAALDVADEGGDANALCGASGPLVDRLAEWSGKGSDIMATVAKTFDLCDEWGVAVFNYDADGLGAGVRGDARVLNERRGHANQPAIGVNAFRGSGAVHRPDAEDIRGRSNGDMFVNAKAQGWWSLRERFRKTHLAVTEGHVIASHDDLISLSSKLPKLAKLKNELSQVTYSQNSVGKLLIDKSPDGSKSPNLADAVMIRFAPGGALSPIVTQASLQSLRKAVASRGRRAA